MRSSSSAGWRVVAGLVLAAVAGCSGPAGPEPTIEDLCARLDDCNYLEGLSASECIDNRRRCVDDLDASQQDDWGVMMDRCLQLQSCSLFGDCWLEVPWC